MTTPVPTSATAPTEELLFEDDELRVWRITLPVGASLRGADHAAATDHFLCVLDGGRALVTNEGGSTAWELKYQRGQAAFIRREDAVSRGYANRGDETMRFLRVEVKR